MSTIHMRYYNVLQYISYNRISIIHIYIYIYTHVYLSLSIYIYTHMCMYQPARTTLGPPRRPAAACVGICLRIIIIISSSSSSCSSNSSSMCIILTIIILIIRSISIFIIMSICTRLFQFLIHVSMRRGMRLYVYIYIYAPSYIYIYIYIYIWRLLYIYIYIYIYICAVACVVLLYLYTTVLVSCCLYMCLCSLKQTHASFMLCLGYAYVGVAAARLRCFGQYDYYDYIQQHRMTIVILVVVTLQQYYM